MSQHRIRGWSGMLAIAALAVAFVFPGAAFAQGTVTGTVVDGSAAGIAGIRVVPVLPDEGGSWREDWGPAVTTGVGGAYTLTLPAGEYRIRFMDPTGLASAIPGEKFYGYEYYPDANWADAGSPVIVTEGGAVDLGEQVLAEGATISGTVTADGGGAPLADIHAVADVQFGGGWPGVVEGMTDGSGEYTIVGLPPGTYQVQFWDAYHLYALERYDDQYAYRLDLAEQFSIAGPESSVAGVDASLAGACSISGTIIGSATPLNGARVWLAAWNDSGQYWMWAQQTMSANDGSADGRYTFPGLRAGTYRLMAEGPDGSWASECYLNKPPIPYAADDVAVGGIDPADVTIDIDLAPAGYIEGWVLGEGEPTVPLKGSPVNVCINQGGWFEAVTWTSTDDAGYFKAGHLAGDTSYYVQFMGGGGWIGEIYDDQHDWSMAAAVPVTAGVTTTLSDAILSRGASIEGHVYGPDGTTPLGNIGVTPVRRVSDGMGNEWFEFRDDHTAWTEGTEPVDGHFLIEGLEPGEWAVRVYDPTGVHAAQFQDGALIPSATHLEAIASGGSWSPVEITMQLGGSIVGTVYDDGDPASPLGGITVAAWIPFGGGYEWIVSATTESDGTYRIDGLSPGEVFIEFQGNTQWLGEYWSMDPAGGTRDRGEADPVLITPGFDAGPFDANLDAAASVSGYVTTGGGATPLGNIAVVPMQFESDGENTWWNHRWDLQDETDGTGHFVIGGLTPGTWSLMYTDPNGMYATEYWHEQSLQSEADMFDITGGGPLAGSYDADLDMGCTITGHVSGVTESDPVDLAGMGISANVDRGDWYESVAWASTGPLGDYTLAGMGAGTYIVEFYGDADWLGQFYSETHPYTRDRMQATPLTLVAGETLTGIDALLQGAFQITGQVTTFDGVDSGLAEGINVMPLTYNEWDQRWEFRWDLQTMTDPEGFYTIGGLDGGDYRIFFQDPSGYWASEFYHDANSPFDGATVGTTSGIWVADEQLVRGNTITGTVAGFVEVSGLVEPLEGISIAAGPFDMESGYYEHITWTNTGSDGAFELAGLPAGSFKVQFWDDGGTYVGEFYDDTTDWSLATPVVFDGAGQSHDLGTVELGIAASVTGHVSDGANDLAGIDVRPMYWHDDGEGGGWWDERWDLSRQTGDDGTFTLTGLSPSEVADTVIVFEDPSGMYAKEYYDGATTPGAATKLALVSGSNDLGEIVLELGNHITGTVTSDGTTGIGEINVAAGPYDPETGQYEHIAWARTSVEEGFEGTYDLGGLPPGSYVVQFWDEFGTYIDQYYSTSEPGTRDMQQATPVIFAGSGETRSDIDAQMGLGSMVSGVVTEPDGTTVVPSIDVVPVVWRSDGGDGGWWEQEWWRSTRTNDQGEFQVMGYLPGDTIRLLVQDQSGTWAYEYYNNALTVDAGTDIGPLAAGDNPLGVIALDPANHIQGTVDSAVGPLGGITVAAGVYDFDAGYYEHVVWTQTSDEDGFVGTYDLGGLPPGSYIVQFWDDFGNYNSKYYDGTPQGNADWYAALPVEFSGTGEMLTGVDVYLEPAATVSGTVFGDDGTGPETLGGIDVELYTFNGEWWDYTGWVQTQDDGTYRLGGLADGAICRLWFSDWTGTWAAEAYADASSWMWGDEVTTTLAVPAEGVDVTLSRAGSITGVVRGDGVPLVGAPVAAGAYDVATDTWDQYFFTETNGDGTYTLSGLKSGVAYRVQAGDYYGVYTWTMWTEGGTGDGDWHSGDDVFVLAPPAEPTVCDFDLRTGGYITGHVENGLGESLAGVEVMLFAPTEVGWDDWWGSFQGVQGSTDASGNYRVGGLYPGDYRILFVPAEGTGYANEYYNDQPALSLATTITVTTLGEQVTVDTAVLSEAAAIEGHVYDDDDPAVPLEGIEVRVAVATGGESGWRDIERSVFTDGAGYYRVEGLRPDDELYVFATDFMGSYLEEWWQEAPGSAAATAVNAPRTGIDFTLRLGTATPSTDISVTPSTPDGQNGWYVSAPSITLTCDDPGATTFYFWDANSAAEYSAPLTAPEGTHTLTYYSVDSFENTETPVNERTFKLDTTAPSTPGDFTAERTGPNSVTLTWSASADAESGIQSYAYTQTGPQSGSGSIGSALTSYTINSMPDGTYTFKLRARNGAGLTSDYTETITVVIDNLAPVATATTVPAAPDGTNGWFKTLPTITLGSAAADLDWIVYRWGDGAETTYTVAFQPPAQGTSTLWWHGADESGNVEAWKSQTFKLDSVAPAAPTGLSGAATGQTTADLSWTAATDATSGVAGYRIYRDGVLAGQSATTSFSATGLSAGATYSFTVRAVDNAGNDGPASNTASVTTEAPPVTYTVTFDSNGGSAIANQTVAHGGLVTKPADPTKTGATFVGWYADAALTDAWVFATDTITGSTTLYAKWTPVIVTTYTVTFEDWDGTVLKTQEVAQGGSATAPAAPTRTGYIFVGWDRSFAAVTSDITVTALYTPDTTIESPVAWETIGGVDYGRVDGALRFDTAAEAALDAFPGGASTAVIAYGRNFPDALAASPLAGVVDGPILLTETATLPAATAAALTDLGVTKVYIVGGTGVVSPAVETALHNLGITDIERLAGVNRYITARKIADEAVALGASVTDAFLVRGDDFADALAVSSIAAQEKIPVLLTTTAALHAETRAFLVGAGTDHVYIAGGTGVVSPAVEATVDGLAGVGVTRWFGANRYLTGADVIRGAMSMWSIPMIDVGLASGENFPDALAGGAVMGHKGGLLLLTQPTVLSAPTATLITENKATIASVEFFGGTGALAPVIPTTVQQLLQ